MIESHALMPDDLRLIQANQEQWAEQVMEIERDLRRLVQHRQGYGDSCVQVLESWLKDLGTTAVRRAPQRLVLIFDSLRWDFDQLWIKLMEGDALVLGRRIEETLSQFPESLPAAHQDLISRIKRSVNDELQRFVELRAQIHGLLDALEQKTVQMRDLEVG